MAYTPPKTRKIILRNVIAPELNLLVPKEMGANGIVENGKNKRYSVKAMMSSTEIEPLFEEISKFAIELKKAINLDKLIIGDMSPVKLIDKDCKNFVYKHLYMNKISINFKSVTPIQVRDSNQLVRDLSEYPEFNDYEFKTNNDCLKEFKVNIYGHINFGSFPNPNFTVSKIDYLGYKNIDVSQVEYPKADIDPDEDNFDDVVPFNI